MVWRVHFLTHKCSKQTLSWAIWISLKLSCLPIALHPTRTHSWISTCKFHIFSVPDDVPKTYSRLIVLVLVNSITWKFCFQLRRYGLVCVSDRRLTSCGLTATVRSYSCSYLLYMGPASWLGGQSSWLLTIRSRIRFPTPPCAFFLERGRRPWSG